MLSPERKEYNSSLKNKEKKVRVIPSKGQRRHVSRLKAAGEPEEAQRFKERILEEKRRRIEVQKEKEKKKKEKIETGEERALKRLEELNKRLEKSEVQEPLDPKEWVETKWRKMWIGMFIRIKYLDEDVDTYSESGKILDEIKLKYPDVHEWASQLINNGKEKKRRFAKWRDEEESFIKGIIRTLS